MTDSALVRYSDEELAEFQLVVEAKLREASEQLALLQDQLLDVTENNSDEHGGDWMDDSSINNEMEMLNNMAIRQRKYIQDLENARIRISNKTYGICVNSGQLIDKRRLMAVPTTTKSVAVKQQERLREEEKTITQLSKTPYIKGEESVSTTNRTRQGSLSRTTPVSRRTSDSSLAVFDEEEADELSPDLSVEELNFDFGDTFQD